MILNREKLILRRSNALRSIIKKIYVRHFKLRSLKGFGINSVRMVLRRNFKLTGFKVFNGVISAPVAEFHFKGFCAERKRYHLMAEADSENRELSLKLAHNLNNRLNILGVTGAVSKEEPVGLHR